MHPILSNIATELDQLSAQIATSIPTSQPFGIAHGNWTFPVMTSEELRERVDEISRDVRSRGKDTLDPTVETRLNDYPRRLQFLRGSTVPNLWGNAQVGVPTLLSSLETLERSLKPALNFDEVGDAKVRLAKLRTQVNGLEARLHQLQPKTMSLEEIVRQIEDTYTAALELPTGLQEVQDAKQSIERTGAAVALHLSKAESSSGEAEKVLIQMEGLARQGREYLEGCESAYRAGIAKGLAGAFLERSDRLSFNMWVWVAGLVLSLLAGVLWGGSKIQELAITAHTPDVGPSTVALDAVMALISVAAPVWFAWLSTRQIGQTFRLSEDYAYKASVARSYEGYRKEAKSVNDDLVEQLLSSAIRRVDEQPLRVVGQGEPGSPWHDLMSSPVISKAFETFPEFGIKVYEMAFNFMRKVPDNQGKIATASMSDKSSA